MNPTPLVQGPFPSTGSQALQRIEAAARRELAVLRAAQSPTSPPDALWATLAWDMGLGGRALEE